MEKQIEIIAYHGWGFSGKIWDALGRLLPETVELKKADRGYFGEEQSFDFTDSADVKIVFTHSFGLHWCPDEVITKADHMVVLNGFAQFAHLKDVTDNRRLNILDAMIVAMEQDPSGLLKQFYLNSGLTAQNIPTTDFIHAQRLKRDLEVMKTSSFRCEASKKVQWIVIDSSDDRIIPGLRGKQLAEALPSSSVFVLETSDHAVPVTKTEECIRILFESIPIFNAL